MEQNPWTITATKSVYDNPWITLTEFQVINPSGGHGIYGKVHFKNLAVGIITLTDDLQTHLVGQYRFVLNAYSWEMPEGGTPVGEDPLKGAQRELQEETGLKATSWTELLRMHLSNSVSDEIAIIYLARGLSQHEAQPEETEQLAMKTLPFDEVYRMVCAGEITDSLTVAAVMKVKLLLVEGKLK
jgi:8-oxo-dGTP pyrophosphatase MutT (NUDIX family)